MSGELVISVIALALVVLPFGGLISSIFLWRVFLSDAERPRSWVLFHLSMGATVATAVAMLIALLAMAKLSNTSTGEAGLLLLSAALLVLELVPIWYAVAVYRLRHGFPPRFPPFRPHD